MRGLHPCQEGPRLRFRGALVLLGRGWLLRARRHRQGAPAVLRRGTFGARARRRSASSGRAGGSVLRRRLVDRSRLPCGLRRVETAACDCGAVETCFLSVGEDGPCETCGVANAPEFSDGCFSCGSVERTGVQLVLQDSRTAECLHSRRSFQCPGRCVRPLRGRLVRAPSGGPCCGHLRGEYP